MLAAALETEVNQQIAGLTAERDERRRRPVVRNGHHRPCTGVTATGPVEMTAPRVNDRRMDEATGERKHSSSKILPPWVPQVPEDFRSPATALLARTVLRRLRARRGAVLGGTAGLSPATVTRLTGQWSDDHAAFRERDLSDRDFVHVQADGAHPKTRGSVRRPLVSWLSSGTRTGCSSPTAAPWTSSASTA
jgi:putative transposase